MASSSCIRPFVHGIQTPYDPAPPRALLRYAVQMVPAAVTAVSRVSLSMPPSFLAISISLLLYSMKPEITVFRLKLSRRVGDHRRPVLWRSFDHFFVCFDIFILVVHEPGSRNESGNGIHLRYRGHPTLHPVPADLQTVRTFSENHSRNRVPDHPEK